MENWKPLISFPAYEISDVGHIRKDGVLLKTQLTSGHITVVLRKEGKACCRSVAKLMAETWLGGSSVPGACVVCKDGDRTNLSISNLTWALRPRHRMWDTEYHRWLYGEWHFLEN